MKADLVAHAKRTDCDCGKSHDVPVEKAAVGPDILEKGFGSFFPDYANGSITVVGDNRTIEITNQFLKKFFLNEKNKITYYSVGDNITSFNEHILGTALIGIPSDTTLLISVGSGTITDCVRYLAFRLSVPFISIPTAPSMDGYASSISPCTINGLKVSLPAGAPVGILADTEIFKTAPADMIAAGFGDLLGKYTCNMDWRLSNVVNDEYFCEYTSSYVIDALEGCLAIAGQFESNELSRNTGILEKLMEGLIVSGLAISMIGYSRAASGAEHIISHFFEFKHLVGEYGHFFHGETVSLGTWIMINLYRKVFSMSFTELRKQPSATDEEKYRKQRAELLKSEYGKYEGPIEAQWNKNSPTAAHKENILQTLESKWQALQKEVTVRLPKPDVVAAYCEKVNVPYRPSHFNFSTEFVKRSIICAKEMRTRYTLLSLLDELFILEEMVDSILGDL